MSPRKWLNTALPPSSVFSNSLTLAETKDLPGGPRTMVICVAILPAPREGDSLKDRRVLQARNGSYLCFRTPLLPFCLLQVPYSKLRINGDLLLLSSEILLPPAFLWLLTVWPDKLGLGEEQVSDTPGLGESTH